MEVRIQQLPVRLREYIFHLEVVGEGRSPEEAWAKAMLVLSQATKGMPREIELGDEDYKEEEEDIMHVYAVFQKELNAFHIFNAATHLRELTIAKVSPTNWAKILSFLLSFDLNGNPVIQDVIWEEKYYPSMSDVIKAHLTPDKEEGVKETPKEIVDGGAVLINGARPPSDVAEG